jgi:cytochrome c-type biogenesis protein CcmE
MKPRHKRIAVIVLGLAGLATAAWLVLSAFNQNLVFFFSPSQVVANEAPLARKFRIGGLVEEGSLRRGADGLTSHFTITDTVNRIPVIYTGILPDLFKEGRGSVAEGKLESDGTFRADQVLAKHDENYMPVEAAHSIEKARQSSQKAGKTFTNQ